MLKRFFPLFLATLVTLGSCQPSLVFASDLDTPFRPGDIPTGLVGYWKFDNNSNDSSTSAYNLMAYNNPTYTSNGDYWKSKYATNLVGASNQYFDIADTLCPNLGITGNFTLFAWVKLNGTTYNHSVIAKWSSGGYEFYITTGGAVNILLDATGVGEIVGTVGEIPQGRWTPIAITYDGATVRKYIDGNLVKVAAWTDPIADNSVPFNIGSRSGSANWMEGGIFDAAVWNVALTPIQIKSLALGVDLSSYAYRPNNVSTQPTHWWKLNEVSGNRVDSIGSATMVDSNTVTSSGGYVEGISSLFTSANSESFSYAGSTDFDLGTGDFTVRFRVKFTTTSGNQDIFDIGTDKLSIRKATGGQLGVDINGSGILTDTWSPTSGVFYDVVVKRTSGNVSGYVDGVATGSPTSGTGNITSTGTVYIGRYSAGATNYLNGNLEDIAIWKGYALTDAEIKSLACALPIQKKGVSLYSKMNASSGNDTDSIGTRTLTASGSPSTGTGKVNGARSFNSATPDYFTVTRDTNLDLLDDFSLIAWSYPDDITDTTIFDKDLNNTGYGLFIGGASNLILYMNNASVATSTASVVNTGFQHFVGAYDGATAKLYINGAIDKSSAYTTDCTNTSVNLMIGINEAGNNYKFDGLLDELVIAQRYFRPEEAKAIYLKGLNSKEVTSTELSPTGERRIVVVT